MTHSEACSGKFSGCTDDYELLSIIQVVSKLVTGLCALNSVMGNRHAFINCHVQLII